MLLMKGIREIAATAINIIGNMIPIIDVTSPATAMPDFCDFKPIALIIIPTTDAGKLSNGSHDKTILTIPRMRPAIAFPL
jgi:hypothetical protein